MPPGPPSKPPIPPAPAQPKRVVRTLYTFAGDHPEHLPIEVIAVFGGQWIPRLTRVGALVGLGRIDEAREEAARTLQLAPWLTVEASMLRLADSAVELRRRRLAVLVAVGFPHASPRASG